MFNIYVANLGAYNRGHLVGKWIKLPHDSLQDELDEILNGNEAIASRDFSDYEDEEWAIHDYETDIKGLKIGEYSDVFELNEFAENFDDLDESDQNKLAAILEWGVTKNIEDALNSLDEYNLHEDIESESDLGYYWLFESGCYEVPEWLENYIDTESYGRDYSIDADGTFTSYGWIEAA